MKDAIFLAHLQSQKLITGDIKQKIGPGSNLTPAEAATYFLDNVVGPAITVRNNEPFSLLLSEMGSFSDNLNDLAEKIKTEIQMLNNPVTGKKKCTVHMYMYVYTLIRIGSYCMAKSNKRII